MDWPPKSKPIKCKWVFKKKYNTDEFIQTLKAKIVVKGFTQKQGIDYSYTYALIGRITFFRVLMALASIYSLHILQMDVKIVFLDSSLDNIYIYIWNNKKGLPYLKIKRTL